MSTIKIAAQLPETGFPIDIVEANAKLKDGHPQAIVRWALEHARNPMVSTNFRPLAAGLLQMVARVNAETTVLWVDTGYNTPATYEYAQRLVAELRLNLQVFTPRITVARREAIAGGIPKPDDPAHAAFVREVKLEPFERALDELKPDIWLTGIRHEQTEFRRTLDIVTLGPHGTIRVAPMFRWTEVDLEGFVYDHGLPDNQDYFDPTKVRDDRECGLQTLT
jgi:phosphoadenosine phosphosulfate reductase